MRSPLLRRLLLAAGGSVGVYCSSYNDTDTSILVSSSPLRELLMADTWPLLCGSHAAHLPSYATMGSASFSPLSFSAISSSDESPKEVGGSGKYCSGCLGRSSISSAAAMVGPAVVNLSIAQSINGIVIGKSMGSGTIIDPDGTILTCAHLVMDIRSKETISKGKVEVTLQDGRSFEGTVISADFHTDIAVVKINSPTPLPAAKLGSSRKLQSGEWVIALGCPLTLQRTITAGIVSCVDRTSRDLGLGGKEREYLQTDCAINEGNSGGPLINLDGEIVGINIMKIANADGLSFAVPIDSIVKLIEHLRKNGRVARPWLGLKLLDLNDRVVAQLKERDILFPDVRKGVFVPMVYPGSPADRAGFLPNDVIIRFDGKPVEQVKEIVEALREKVGMPVKVIVQRAGGKLVTLTVVPEVANTAT
ncbi:putative protease Do-like 14 [Acorus calamus]|uniref:Protease Do-like 14 n=1 Tax=Acorus calamus TaxID=4465 RepID=A0AAV9CEB4_ACOCL|nr:putative protease Do-like 14 [Acorus calamus]